MPTRQSARRDGGGVCEGGDVTKMIIKKNASKSTSAIASCERGLLRHKKPCSRTLVRKSENPKFRSKNPDLTVSLRENTI